MLCRLAVLAGVVALGSSAGSAPLPAAQSPIAPPAVKEAFLRQPAFMIPFDVDPTVSEPIEVQLYSSTDRGATWQLADRQRPTARQFAYRAAQDGPFWFASKTIGARGSRQAEMKPELLIHVDTRQPQLDFQVTADADGRLSASWEAFDPLLIPESFRIEYRSGPQQPWQAVSIRLPAAGSTLSQYRGDATWIPDSASTLLDVRAEIRDRAGNLTVVNRQVPLPRVARGDEAPVPSTQTLFGARRLPEDPYATAASAPASGSAEAELPVAATPSSVPTGPSAQSSAVAGAWNRESWPRDNGPSPQGPADASGWPPHGRTSEAAVAESSSVGDEGRPSTNGSHWARSESTSGLGNQGGILPGSNSSASPQLIPTSSRSGNEVADARVTMEELPPPPSGRRDDDVTGRQPPYAPASDSRWSEQEIRPAQRLPLVEQGSDSLPGLSNEARLPTGERPVFTASRKFKLDYDVDAVGNGGVAEAQLWATVDSGRRWTLWSKDQDRESPCEVEVLEDGVYGFRMVIVGTNGLASPEPLSGEPADIWVAVDTAEPIVRMTGAEYGRRHQAGKLLIRWEARDAHLASRPIRISFAAASEGPWTIAAAELPNSGEYAWGPDASLPRQLFLRVDAIDEAGNVGGAQLSQPISLDGLAPKGRIRGISGW